MIIDSHQHVFWHWRNDADLIADMDAHGIDLAWLLTWEISPAEWDPNWARILNPIHAQPDGTNRGVSFGRGLPVCTGCHRSGVDYLRSGFRP